MTKLQIASLCAAAFGGCFLGSYLAQRPALVAQAQQRVQVNDYLTVGNGGLRLVTPNGTLVGLFSVTGDGLSFQMMNSGGRPSVSLVAGTTGSVAIGSDKNGSGMVVQGPDGQQLEAVIRGSEPSFVLGTSGRMSGLKGGPDPSFKLFGRATSPIFEAKSLPDGGQVSLFSRAGKKLFDLNTNLDTAKATFDGPEGVQAEVNGKGQMTVRKAGQTIWAEPKQGVSTGSSQGGPPGSTGGGVY